VLIPSLLKSWSPGLDEATIGKTLCNVFILKKKPSLEPLIQFQGNLVKMILGLREFKFVPNNGHDLFKGVIIAKMQN
jgi:hypothetical protein